MKTRLRPTALLVCILTGLLMANVWANVLANPELPLQLTVGYEPPIPTQGGVLTFFFDLQNLGEIGVWLVQLDVLVPQGTRFQTAQAENENWRIEQFRDAKGEMVRYTASGLGGQSAVRLTLAVVVESGPLVVLDTYTLNAEGLASPIVGEPVIIPVATPAASATPPLTSTPSATHTPLPTPTERPSPTPSPTVTVVLAELPPTPTPKLSDEKEQLGALTVSIFVLLTLIIALAAAIWVFRARHHSG